MSTDAERDPIEWAQHSALVAISVARTVLDLVEAAVADRERLERLASSGRSFAESWVGDAVRAAGTVAAGFGFEPASPAPPPPDTHASPAPDAAAAAAPPPAAKRASVKRQPAATRGSAKRSPAATKRTTPAKKRPPASKKAPPRKKVTRPAKKRS